MIQPFGAAARDASKAAKRALLGGARAGWPRGSRTLYVLQAGKGDRGGSGCVTSKYSRGGSGRRGTGAGKVSDLFVTGGGRSAAVVGGAGEEGAIRVSFIAAWIFASILSKFASLRVEGFSGDPGKRTTGSVIGGEGLAGSSMGASKKDSAVGRERVSLTGAVRDASGCLGRQDSPARASGCTGRAGRPAGPAGPAGPALTGGGTTTGGFGAIVGADGTAGGCGLGRWAIVICLTGAVKPGGAVAAGLTSATAAGLVFGPNLSSSSFAFFLARSAAASRSCSSASRLNLAFSAAACIS